MVRKRLPLWAKVASGVTLFVVITGMILVIFAPSLLKAAIEHEGSAKLHRRVVIHGPVTIDWSAAPRITVNALTVSNPAWAEGRMASVKQARLRIALWPLLHGRLVIQGLTLRHPRIHLEKPSPARANWVFARSKKTHKTPYAFPQIGRLVVTHGLITVDDVPAYTHLVLTVQSRTPSTYLILRGHGRYKGSRFTLVGALGSPTTATKPHAPYPVLVEFRIGRFFARIDGALTGPLALKRVDLHVLLVGAGLGRVNKAVNLPLPQTGPFRISGQLTNAHKTWTLAHFRGLVGKSDLEGTISVRPGHPTDLHAVLVSRNLDFKDLAGFVKAKPKEVHGQVRVVAHAQSAQKVLPAKPYKRSHLLKLNADVIYRAEHVYASHMRIQDLDAHLVLQNGIVRLDPLNFGVANGLVRADLTMDVSRPLYETQLRAIARGIHLRLLFPKIKFKSAGTGRIGGRLALAAPGNSIAAMAAHATGHLGLALAGGTINSLYVALAQIHVGNAALDWLSGMKQERIPCAVVRLRMRNGLVRTRTFLIDTPSANILGRGTINMRSQALHLTIYTKPKHVSLISARGALTVAGTFKKPTFSVDRTAVIERAGAAVALGALLTPAAALLPLIDAAPGHKVDCPALLQKAGPRARDKALKNIAKRTKSH